jgi:hypothetical protein
MLKCGLCGCVCVSLSLWIVILFTAFIQYLCSVELLYRPPARAYIAEVCFNVLVLFLHAPSQQRPSTPFPLLDYPRNCANPLSLPNHCSIIESTHDSTPLSPGYPSVTLHTQSAHLPSHKSPSSPSLSYTASLHLSSLGCPLFVMLRRPHVGIGTFYSPLH